MLREGVSKLANLAAGLVTTAAKDTIVKNAIADFATEHFEMACYRSLILTSTALGETKIATACKGILKEEEAMAALLESQFKGVNDAYLSSLDEDEEEPSAPTGKIAAQPAGRRPVDNSAGLCLSRSGCRGMSEGAAGRISFEERIIDGESGAHSLGHRGDHELDPAAAIACGINAGNGGRGVLPALDAAVLRADVAAELLRKRRALALFGRKEERFPGRKVSSTKRMPLRSSPFPSRRAMRLLVTFTPTRFSVCRALSS